MISLHILISQSNSPSLYYCLLGFRVSQTADSNFVMFVNPLIFIFYLILFFCLIKNKNLFVLLFIIINKVKLLSLFLKIIKYYFYLFLFFLFTSLSSNPSRLPPSLPSQPPPPHPERPKGFLFEKIYK